MVRSSGLWWVNTSGSTTGAVLFDRWVGKAVLGRAVRQGHELTGTVGAGTWDFTAAGRSVLRTMVRFWRRFAVGCTAATRSDFQKFQARQQSILAAADVSGTDGTDGGWGTGPYCVWHSGLADAVARACGDAAWMAADEIAGCAACAAAAAATVAAEDAESTDSAGEAAAVPAVCDLVGGNVSDVGCCAAAAGGTRYPYLPTMHLERLSVRFGQFFFGQY